MHHNPNVEKALKQLDHAATNFDNGDNSWRSAACRLIGRIRLAITHPGVYQIVDLAKELQDELSKLSKEHSS